METYNLKNILQSILVGSTLAIVAVGTYRVWKKKNEVK
jgi:hypothetical protein